MHAFNSLISRNILIFYRNKSNILFATLSILILVALHFILFQDMYSSDWNTILSSLNISIEPKKLDLLVDVIMFGALIPIGSVTISFAVLGQMVADRETRALDDFMVSPITRNQLLSSYIVSSFIVGLTMLSGLLLASFVYLYVTYGVLVSLTQVALLIAVTIYCLLFANCLTMFIVSFVKRQQTLSSLGTILGTSLGFLSGAYIPIGLFGDKVASVLSTLPFVQLTALAKLGFLYDLDSFIGFKLSEIPSEVTHTFGLEVIVGNYNLEVRQLILFVFAYTIIIIIMLIIKWTTRLSR